MDDVTTETWQHKIREMASQIEDATSTLYKTEADMKKLGASLELQAMATGTKTISAQKTIAENDPKLYDARLAYGIAKGKLSGLKIILRSIEVGFEEYRTKNANMRAERTKYGA